MSECMCVYLLSAPVHYAMPIRSIFVVVPLHILRSPLDPATIVKPCQAIQINVNTGGSNGTTTGGTPPDDQNSGGNIPLDIEYTLNEEVPELTLDLSTDSNSGLDTLNGWFPCSVLCRSLSFHGLSLFCVSCVSLFFLCVSICVCVCLACPISFRFSVVSSG
jgi:hypothetical protein